MDSDDYCFVVVETAFVLLFLFFVYALAFGWCRALATGKKPHQVVVWMPRWYLKRERRWFGAVFNFVGTAIMVVGILLIVTCAGAIIGGVLSAIGAKLRGK